MFSKYGALLSIFALGFLVAETADAALVVPDATYAVSFNPPGTIFSGTPPATVKFGDAQVVFSTNPHPSLDAFSGLITAQGSLAYYFGVEGPSGVFVPLDISYSMSTPSDPPVSTATALITVGGVPEASIGSNQSQSGIIKVTEVTNSTDQIGLGFTASGNPNFGAAASAIIDPVISIDPSFAAADPNFLQDFTIVLSPGVGNSEAPSNNVPEPASLALFGTALAGLGILRRRRKTL